MSTSSPVLVPSPRLAEGRAAKRLRSAVSAVLASVVGLGAVSSGAGAAALPQVRLGAPASGDLTTVGHRDRRGDAAIAGVLGLAAGAIIGGALVAPQRRYYAPGPVIYYDRRYAPYGGVEVYSTRRYVPAPTYALPPAPRHVYRPVARPEPWTAAWASYCEARYRSFDLRSGTFMGYDGKRHFCR